MGYEHRSDSQQMDDRNDPKRRATPMAEAVAEKLHQMTIEQVPHSSVVGGSLKIVAKDVGVVAILAIMVPQPHLDYRTVADAVAKAILSGHVSAKGCTLVLPDDFVPNARKAVGR